ncbi:unnamed protein product [Prorocentrum cordatum]|uniref:Phosphoglycerate mutase (2,3-diphosphoglycerate-dependent) n=1 Tax=Prorocentrum cordatum TaxID=2364126 RepID=A0ABN9QBZ2_9DINO|nr:unnamed protein product [Polarella glacialis]
MSALGAGREGAEEQAFFHCGACAREWAGAPPRGGGCPVCRLELVEGRAPAFFSQTATGGATGSRAPAPPPHSRSLQWAGAEAAGGAEGDERAAPAGRRGAEPGAKPDWDGLLQLLQMLQEGKFQDIGTPLAAAVERRRRRLIWKRLPPKIVLLRHGESEGHADRITYTSKGDSLHELTPRGLCQAIEAGARLRELVGQDRMFVCLSPYECSQQTLLGLYRGGFPESQVEVVHTDPQIRERDLGNFQDPGLLSKVHEEERKVGRYSYRPDNGESCADVLDRVSCFWDRLLSEGPNGLLIGRRDEYDTCLVLTHGLPIRLLLMRIFGWSVETFETVFDIGHCDHICLVKNMDTLSYNIWEEMSHPPRGPWATREIWVVCRSLQADKDTEDKTAFLHRLSAQAKGYNAAPHAETVVRRGAGGARALPRQGAGRGRAHVRFEAGGTPSSTVSSSQGPAFGAQDSISPSNDGRGFTEPLRPPRLMMDSDDERAAESGSDSDKKSEMRMTSMPSAATGPVAPRSRLHIAGIDQALDELETKRMRERSIPCTVVDYLSIQPPRTTRIQELDAPPSKNIAGRLGLRGPRGGRRRRPGGAPPPSAARPRRRGGVTPSATRGRCCASGGTACRGRLERTAGTGLAARRGASQAAAWSAGATAMRGTSRPRRASSTSRTTRAAGQPRDVPAPSDRVLRACEPATFCSFVFASHIPPIIITKQLNFICRLAPTS